MRKNNKYVFDFRVKSEGEKEEGLYIEGFANRAMIKGEKVIDRGLEHIPASEWNVKEWLKNPIIFFNHDRDQPIGKGVGAEVTEDGLKIKVKISNSDAPDIKRVRDLISEGILKTFSVGIDVASEQVEEDGSITLKGVNLLETSVVSIPMNQESFFSISKKMLAEDQELEAKILKAKGAWVASAIHGRIYDLQSEGDDFNRAEALMEIAESADISQGELMAMLAGNTATFPEEVLQAVATVLDFDIETLLDLNERDSVVAGQDESLVAEEEIEEDEEEEIIIEEEEEEAEEELEDESLEDQEGEEEGSSEREEDSGMDGGQSDSDTSEDSEDVELENEEAGDDDTELEDEDDQEDDNKECDDEEHKALFDNVVTLLEGGHSKDEALAATLAKLEGDVTAEQMQKLMESLESYEKKKEKQAETQEINTTDSLDINLGQPIIMAAQQTNVLLGQLVAEMQENNKLLREMMNKKITDEFEEDMELAEDGVEENEEDLELEEDGEDEKSINNIDTIKKFQENIDRKLKKFGV